MKVSAREAGLGVLTGILVLFSVSYLLVVPKVKVWQEERDAGAVLDRRLDVAQRLVDDRPRWDQAMTGLRARLSRYPESMDVTADYLRILERVATASAFTLVQRKPQKEKRQGDCFEMPIDCTWEGDLPSLVRFLFALKQEPVTMDIEELNASLVAGSQGRLKGTFSLMCIYTREDIPPADVPSNALPSAAPSGRPAPAADGPATPVPSTPPAPTTAPPDEVPAPVSPLVNPPTT